jgi:endonuclease G
VALNLNELSKAAARFDAYRDALARAHAQPELVQAERERVAERHRNVFRPAAERMLSQPAASAPATMTDSIVIAPSAPADTGSPLGAILPLVASPGGVVPEIIQRDNDLRPIRFLHVALLAARAVGRIRIAENLTNETGDATGFMVAPGLLMTNWHVLKTADIAAAASIIFDDEDGIDGDPLETKAFRLRPDRLFINDEALDYAIVEVSPRTASGIPLAQFGFLRLYRQIGKLDPTQRQAVNIIQHPGGGPKKIALRDNYVLEVVPELVDPAKNEISLYYGTDTLKGSSGAPVCSDQWYVVAVHRGGVPETTLVNGQRVVVRLDGTPATVGDSEQVLRYLANEGTRISRIYHILETQAATDLNAAEALERLNAVAADPRMGPVSLRTMPILLPALPVAEAGGAEEIIRRSSERFAAAVGYDPTFLGADHHIDLPQMTSEVQRELATLKDSNDCELKYTNYSVFMNRERRTAFFIAGNIDGSQRWGVQGFGGLPRRPKWSWDPRMDERFQPDDAIFSIAMQRGHLFKREDAVWGADETAMRRADEHSFTLPNATPMIAHFNNVEWGDLEDLITDETEAGHKLSYFAGPIFRSSDRFFNELRLDVPPAERRKGMRVPQSFWKIVAWIEESQLKAAGFILSQADEIERHGPIVEEIDFGKYRSVPIAEIERAIGLRFPELLRVDIHPA